MKSVVLTAFLSVAFVTLGGNTCTWTGLGVDNKWGTAENWDTPPVSGNHDILILEDAGTTENDIADLAVKTIKFAGTQAAVLTGQQIVFDDPGCTMSSNLIHSVVALTISTPLKLADGIKGNFSCMKQAVIFNGAITLGDGAILKIGTTNNSSSNSDVKRLDFNGPIVGENARVVLSHGYSNENITIAPGVWFNDVVKVKELTVSINYSSNYINLCKPGNEWMLSSAQGASVRAQVAGAFPETAVFDWWNQDLNNGGNYPYGWMPDDKDTDDKYFGCYNLNGYDQTIDRLAGQKEPIDWNKGWHNTFSVWSKEPATLTMKATGVGKCPGRINGALTLVWDPQGVDAKTQKKFDLTLDNRINKTTGDIVVKGGRVLVTRAGTFKNLNAIDVRSDAGFVLDSTEANALENLKKLTLRSGATFEVAATAATPFGTSDGPKLQMSATAILVVPEGMTLNVSDLMLDGERINDTTYEPGSVPWLTGGGSLTVAAANPPAGVKVWKSARDGVWGMGDNWLGGTAPGATDAAEVSVPYEGNYAAKIAADLAYDGDLTVANDLGGTATVEVVSGTWTRGGTSMVLNAGGAVAVDDGATLAFAANYSGVKVPGGALVVRDGGAVNMNVTPTDSTSVNNGGVVRVEEGGSLTYKGQANSSTYPYDSKTFDVMAGGRLEVAGGTAQFIGANYYCCPLQLSGGEVACSGNGVLDIRLSTSGCAFGDGKVTMSGDSALYLTNSAYRLAIPGLRASKRQNARIVLEDRAHMTCVQDLYLGNNSGNLPTDPANEAELTFDSDATSTLKMAMLGSATGKGTLNVGSGVVAVDGVLRVGCCAVSSDVFQYYQWASTVWHSVGALNVSGGELKVRGADSWNTTRSANNTVGQIFGLVLGDGEAMPKDKLMYSAGYDATGSLTVSGGKVTVQQYANFVAGAGYGSASVKQTGGTLAVQRVDDGAILGFLGGVATYEMGGGAATFASDLFVGGVTTNEIGWVYLKPTGKTYTETLDVGQRHDAVGTLTVTGGTMTVAKKLVLSADGTGSLVVGEGGTLTAANIELRDSTATGGGKTTVAFKLGPTGIGLVKTTGTLTVASGTKLVVDASDYEGDKGVKLMDFAAIDGEFDIQPLVQPKVGGRRIVVTPTGIKMSSGRGAMLIVR